MGKKHPTYKLLMVLDHISHYYVENEKVEDQALYGMN